MPIQLTTEDLLLLLGNKEAELFMLRRRVMELEAALVEGHDPDARTNGAYPGGLEVRG